MMDANRLALTVQKLREQGTDDGRVEVKECARQLSGDIWETVSAFANTAGGLIILGLSEKQGFVPVENFELERVRDQFIAGIGEGGSAAKVTNAPAYTLSRGEIDGIQVLLIEIEELDIKLKPCFVTVRGVQKGSFKRVDDKDILLSATELYDMQSSLIPSDADASLVPESSREDLDPEIVKSVIATCRIQTPRMLRGADTREKQLERLNIANKDGILRLAGLLATGMYPQQFFPKLVIDVAVHPDADKSAPGEPRFLDRQICDGPAAVCIEDALMAIGRNLRKSSRIVGAGRVDEWEIPQEVLREALANAVIHREYSPMFVGQSVSVDIYPDRMEILNPGGLWGGKTLENLDNGDSRCRNPKLMSLMRAVPMEHADGNVAESQGSGVRAMIREMESRSLGRPRFIAKPDSFKVVLLRHGVELEQNRAWLSEHAGRTLNDREEILLMAMKERDGGLTVGDARALLRWDSDDIRRVCGQLEADGIISAVGKDAYALAKTHGYDSEASPQKRGVRERIVLAIPEGASMSAREIADALGIDVARVRYYLPALINDGLLRATAGVHDRNRRYEHAPMYEGTKTA